MALSALEDRSHEPTLRDLDAVLAKSAPRWKKVVAGVTKHHAPVKEQWNFAGAKFGWSLRLRKGDRVVLYLIPQSNGFLAGIVLGEKAFEAARAAGIRRDVLDLIEAAPKYAEGRGIRFPVRNEDDVKTVLMLVAIKLAPVA